MFITAWFIIARTWKQLRCPSVDEWNRIERPEINMCIFGQLIYDKGGKNTVKTVSSISDAWKNWMATCKRRLECFLILCIKTNSMV